MIPLQSGHTNQADIVSNPSRLPSISAIMPVYNAAEYLGKSLPPLLDSLGRDLLEVIVVDDCSTDGSRDIAERMGAHIMSSGARLGPAAARNLAAREARGDVLFWVDADVAVHAGAAARVRLAFASSDVVAVFGSYDDHPPDPGFWSQYKNLLHHHVHQGAAEEASTFWTGCGAVRRESFLSAGGFDSNRYPLPSIEDIELGYRLRAAGGRIQVLHDLQATHFKRWTLTELIRTDIFRRAIPWSRLILEHPAARSDLNVTPAERARALAAMALVASVLLAIGGLLPAWSPAGIFLIGSLSNVSLFSLFRRRNGLLFAVGGMLFHQVYYVYSSLAFAWCYLGHRLGSFKRAP